MELNQIKRLGIKVHTGVTATKELLQNLKPYAIVAATGSNEATIPIPGIDGDNVLDVREVLRNRMQVSDKDIVILGGGMTGLETARFFRQQGNRVSVLEMMPKPEKMGIDVELTIRDTLEDGVKIFYEHKVEKIGDSTVTAENLASGEKVLFDANLVVPSLGVKSNTSLVDELKGASDNIYSIGDCGSLGKIYSAVQSGCDLGHSLK